MQTVKDALVEAYNAFIKEEIANEMIRIYDLDGPKENLIHNIGAFEETLNSIEGEVNTKQIIVESPMNEGSNGIYYHIHVAVEGEDTTYSTSYIPFREILLYGTNCTLKDDIILFVSFIWELTFDGFTEERQDESIGEFIEIVNGLDL